MSSSPKFLAKVSGGLPKVGCLSKCISQLSERGNKKACFSCSISQDQPCNTEWIFIGETGVKNILKKQLLIFHLFLPSWNPIQETQPAPHLLPWLVLPACVSWTGDCFHTCRLLSTSAECTAPNYSLALSSSAHRQAAGSTSSTSSSLLLNQRVSYKLKKNISSCFFLV